MCTFITEPDEWEAGHNITGTLTIGFINRANKYKSRTKTFKVTSRVLEPEAVGSEMEGTDVAMLEELLWQLGLSPQKGAPDPDKVNKFAGAFGARVASNRSDKFLSRHS